MNSFGKVKKKLGVFCANIGEVYAEGFGTAQIKSPNIRVGNVRYITHVCPSACF